MPELEGVALELAVADRVMGWKRVDYNSPEDFKELPCFHPFRYADGEAVTVYREGATCGMGWSPLRSMDAAWKVVDAMAAKGYEHNLMTDSKGCTSLFAKEAGDDVPVYSGHSCFGKPGEAILRAALAAEGEKE